MTMIFNMNTKSPSEEKKSCANSNFIKALKRENVSQNPIWVMRQAGRYLPEYNATRKKAGSFLKLCKTPELACEVTLQPINRFGLDAAIIFSDILTVPDAMGLGLEFVEGEGPKFAHPISDIKAVEKIQVEGLNEKLNYVFAAIKLTRGELAPQIPLIGFTGSPFTLACYMIEGQGSRDFAKVKKLMFTEPTLMHSLLDKITQAVINYLIAQIESGADALQIFDTWGGMLAADDYQKFSLAYMAKITRAVRVKYPQTPLIIFTKGGGLWLESMAECADALGIDWSVPIDSAFSRVGQKVAIQGNLDPMALLAKPHDFIPMVNNILTKVQRAREIAQNNKQKFGFIFNLGHGITPQVEPDNVRALVEAVHNFKVV